MAITSLAKAYSTKQPTATSQFYKTFSRPIAKALLTAVLTYQLAYWGWVKLETDELRAQADATVADLEAKVKEYDKSSAKPESTPS